MLTAKEKAIEENKLLGLDPTVDIPEDVENLSEYIDSKMKDQPDEPILDQYMECISNIKPEVIPSFIDYDSWKCMQPEFLELHAELMIREDELDTTFLNRYQDEVVIPYRKELREWYMKRKKSFPPLSFVETDGMYFDKDDVNITNDKINDAINKSVEKIFNVTQDNGTEDTSTEGSGSN